MIGFEWDEKKAKINLKNHQISFEEGATIFNDLFVATIHDSEHSIDEERYISIGMSAKGRVLIVVHNERGEKTRIIRCRKATPDERGKYEKGNY
jgi:uncharacterized DUF497 family protein